MAGRIQVNAHAPVDGIADDLQETSRHLKAHRHMRHALEENGDDFDVQFSMGE